MSTTTATRSTWDIDAVHSDVGFTVRHLVISKVRGRFDRWSGVISLDDARPEHSRVDVRIETASIDTHEPQRDAHLRSPDFFDVEKYPVMEFHSTHIERADGSRWQVTGDLTISGVTRPVRLDVETLGKTKDPWGGERVGFSARTTIDRRDFGLVWNQTLETGGVVVGEKIEIGLEIEAVRRAEEPSGKAA